MTSRSKVQMITGSPLASEVCMGPLEHGGLTLCSNIRRVPTRPLNRSSPIWNKPLAKEAHLSPTNLYDLPLYVGVRRSCSNSGPQSTAEEAGADTLIHGGR
mmetsp:Transcript_11243/g.16412  ORF Transcript_11243/g.16412 Transcript_11243/m.16412 type:complete len:101 (-) Transcript_11243:1613-1915(-)